MGLMTTGDWAAMQADLTAIRDDNAVSITIRRGNTTLAAQTVRLARAGRANRPLRSESGTRATTAVVVLGLPTLDIQVEDRFTVAGILYEVDYVNPNRRSRTEAEATAVE